MTLETTWRELPPSPAMTEAIAFAEQETPRAAIRAEVARIAALISTREQRRERAILRDMRKRWSERFATASASMIANEIRTHTAIRSRFDVQPDTRGGGQETFTPLGYKKGKRIDVVVAGPLVGLQVGISLKGLNFADDSSGNHDKNLTGRLYELRDEVSTVHEYLPRAFMAAVIFMPLAGCLDKVGAPSSFAHLVAELRARTGRLDPSVVAHAWRCDFSAVGLYSPGDPEDSDLGIKPGVFRIFPLEDEAGHENSPPRRGLPRIASTVDLAEFVDRLIGSAISGSAVSIRYAPAEGEVSAPPIDAEQFDLEMSDEEEPDDDL
ncbi:MAG TPA: hypothetical protein VJ935_08200 [Acidimicrobiia bacterium]|nr:hypothetical protein [Acidimicrobiia bacterium]